MGRPARIRRHAPISKGMQDLDAMLEAAEVQRARGDELAAIVASLHQIESAIRVPVADLLRALADNVSAGPASPTSQTMSSDQEAALRAAGSFVDEMAPIGERASTTALQRISGLVANALSTDEAAARLGVTPRRVRQRLSNRTLISVKVANTHRLPAFQFTDAGELPGWDRVAPVFPVTAHPTAIAWCMQTPHPDLTVAGRHMSPTDWLVDGGDTRNVVDLIATAFVVHAS